MLFKTFGLVAAGSVAVVLAQSSEFSENLGAASVTAQMGYADGLAGQPCGTGLAERTGLASGNALQDVITQMACDAGEVQTAFARGRQTAQFTDTGWSGATAPVPFVPKGSF